MHFAVKPTSQTTIDFMGTMMIDVTHKILLPDLLDDNPERQVWNQHEGKRFLKAAVTAKTGGEAVTVKCFE